ncbi:threonine dehydratase [Fortiea sp. LEGE XX443]|uniref:threonine dehydratase n=1 Tax=Fortiea sp. LEGE XX443 TaxID=1828611 RepID=UPI001880D075|nr:threonine dehydratase [Fortiea sp. LEGE XX443]MBE9007348.1 threonine dehydratase [Fortiea sp. LEGE XX443]
MDRLIQVIRNLFIRLEGYFSVVFKAFLSFISNIFGFFAKLFGFSSSVYYLESDAAQTIQRASDEKPTKIDQNTTSEIPTTTRRRSKAKVEDYYLNMARDVKKN